MGSEEGFSFRSLVFFRSEEGSKLSKVLSLRINRFVSIYIRVTKRYKKGGWTKTCWERKWLVFPYHQNDKYPYDKYPSTTFRYALGRI